MSVVRALVTAFLISVAAISPIAAQGGGGEVRGRITNAGNVAIPTATVELFKGDVTVASARTATAADGSFAIHDLAPGRYRVRIRALGYVPRDVPGIDVTSQATDVGTVTLKTAVVDLQAVVVGAEREKNVEMAPDRNTYTVRDMPTTRGGSALDVLRNVPSVDVDLDNIVSLRGSSAVTVQINGRPSPLKPDQLGNFLGQLPADMVDKVEIIPNPSARDDPTGVAGIINLVLKEDSGAGANGGVTLAGGTTGQVSVGGNAGYQRGPLSLYGSYGLLKDRRPRADSIFRANTYLTPVTYLDERGSRIQKPLAHTLTGSAGYQLGKQDELSMDLMYSTRRQSDYYNLLYRELNAQRIVTGTSDRTTRGTGRETNFESALGFKHRFADKQRKFSSELRVVSESEGGPGNVTARALSADLTPLVTTAFETQQGWEYPSENSFKADYVHPLSKTMRFETGYKGSFQRIHTTLDTRVLGSQGAFVPDPTRMNDFTYRQLVNAVYGMLGADIGNFRLQGGLRAERAATQFHLKTLNSTFSNPYSSLFPSALVLYNVDEASQVKLSYSTRIRRPDDTDVLDPTPHYADPLNLSIGNPYLRPEYTRALELGLQRTGEHTTIQLTPFFRRTLDAVRPLRTINSAGVSTRTYANIATSDAYGADANVARSGEKLSGFAGASAYRQKSDAGNVGSNLSISTFGWRARTNVSYRLSSTEDLQALFSYQAPMKVEQGTFGSRIQLSFAARKKLMQDQLSIALRVIDPLKTSRERSTTIDPKFYQYTERARVVRGLVLSVNWMFGKQDKERGDLIEQSDQQPPQ